MGDDIRAALAAAVRATPDPDARVQRWLAAVPRYAARTSTARRSPARSVAAGLVVLLAAGLAGSSAPARRMRTEPIPPSARVVIVAANACPPGEKRFDEETAGYHVCLPATWSSRVSTRDPSADGYVSVIGFGSPGAADRGLRPDAEAWASPLLITVTQQPLVQASELEQISEPRIITIASQVADEVQLDGGGRRALVSRGDLLYSIELNDDSPEALQAYEEVLSTFSFRGLPYLADPELPAGTG